MAIFVFMFGFIWFRKIIYYHFQQNFKCNASKHFPYTSFPYTSFVTLKNIFKKRKFFRHHELLITKLSCSKKYFKID